MKRNLPVTTVETLLPEGEFIYSRTDLTGTIEEANEAFARISGYAREEMIGQPHNMVRHPDMPAEAFADMWKDLKAGRPWRGIVKNRRQDGGFYWVEANASPVRENGRVVGYQSVRCRPTRAEVKAAEDAYARIRAGDRSLYVEHGRVVRRRPAVLLASTSLHTQMRLASAAALLPAGASLFAAASPAPLPPALLIAVAALSVCYALFFLLFATPRVQRDLAAISTWLEKILHSGDLRHRLDLDRRDLVGGIARKADKLTSSVRATLQGVNDIAGQVANATREVHAGIRQVEEAAETQNAATTSAAAAIEEVTVSIGSVASHAHTTRGTAEQAGKVALEGAEVTRTASRTIQSLADVVNNAARQVESLGQRSAEISRIAGVIREIADQTNLLALNAAIEAARAGEQGRGFAVVADEVRKLAERTGAATGEINTMIERIQADTAQAVECMRTGAHQVHESVNLANETESSLDRINLEMGHTIHKVAEISSASLEQQTALSDLSRSVEAIAAMSEQNVAVVGQTRSMADVLHAAEQRMSKAVQQYQL